LRRASRRKGSSVGLNRAAFFRVETGDAVGPTRALLQQRFVGQVVSLAAMCQDGVVQGETGS
jgi:hypothetical protein